MDKKQQGYKHTTVDLIYSVIIFIKQSKPGGCTHPFFSYMPVV